MFFTVIFLAFTANAQTSKRCSSGSSQITEIEKQQILDAHNKIRTKLKLSKLFWDCKLAEIAQDWANRGTTEHRPENNFGENIYVSLIANHSTSAAVPKWLLEEAFWNNISGVCQPGKVCIHYTQMVWKKTTKVGCGVNRNASGKWKTVVVCNYDPAGNYKGSAY